MNVSGVYFELLRSVLSETELCNDVKNTLTPEIMPKLYKLSKVHDTAH